MMLPAFQMQVCYVQSVHAVMLAEYCSVIPHLNAVPLFSLYCLLNLVLPIGAGKACCMQNGGTVSWYVLLQE